MARLNVYVPDDLAGRAKAARLNISALTQNAIAAELERQATGRWLDSLPAPRHQVTHEAVLAALDEARAELERHGDG
ncbi:type II toxin-antitoxin system CcdA family antitoxin [Saccharomonospora xinjiangensis]|uniref:type II toxin-antitoxin system CcdA family antitoxin n=1 Tax=Saccharomonospora xinjiangensis TaxID=75294 RepID=UPI00350F6D19